MDHFFEDSRTMSLDTAIEFFGQALLLWIYTGFMELDLKGEQNDQNRQPENLQFLKGLVF